MNSDENFDPYASYMSPEEPVVNNKRKKGRKSFFKKAAGFVAGAVLFGAIGGAVCYGLTYAGYNIFPVKVEQKEATEPVVIQQGGLQVSADDVKKEISYTVMDVSEIVDSVISSVVAINGTYNTSYGYGIFGGQTYQSTVSGSGIIIGTNETELLVVTNAHVVEDVDSLAVTFYDGSSANAIVKGMKSNKDLAVIAVKLNDIPSEAVYSTAKLGETSEIKVGNAAIAVGNSMGYGISVTTGCISALDRTVTVDKVEYSSLIQTDAAINPGNSGGALFNAYGEVIGINSVKMSTTGVEGMGYAISISSVKEIIEELSLQTTREKYSDDDRGYIGITGVNITEDINEMYGYPVGIQVRSVAEDSAADKAGIIKGDIIISFDGEEVYDFNELSEKMCYYAVGEEVEIEYYHMSDGRYEKKQATLVLTPKS